ncbi:MAG: sigma-70 family RNA polymerase sigma factor [Chloroflexi bacterium]|nr:sigma-70 family RNA polymerase sigma factor [Chloroflexota bacterium]
MSLEAGASDRELVLAARQGDRGAFETLVARHSPALLNVCRRMLHDGYLAEDARQEATLRALLALDRLEAPEKFASWFLGIGLNVCRAWLREQRRGAMREAETVDVADPEAGPEELALAAEVARRVNQALAALPAGQRRALELFYLAGLDQTASAARLRIPVGALKTRLHKGRAALRGSLARIWEEEFMERQPQPQLVAVHVADVWRYPEDERHRQAIALQEEGGAQRLLCIWVGTFEGESIARLIQRTEQVRPLPHELLASLLDTLGARVSDVRINALREGTFYAEVVVEGPSGTATVDARPSDAISLALTVAAPIRASRPIMDAAGMTPEELEARRRSPGPGWWPRGEPEPASRIVELIREAEIERRRFAQEHGLNMTVAEPRA